MFSLNSIIGKAKCATFGALLVACSLGFAPQVSAVSLDFDSALMLGLTPGEPSSPTDEATYINFLIDMVPGTTSSGPSSPPDYTRTSNVLCYPLCPDATATGAVTDNSGDATGDFGDGYTYLLAKYDGPNGGDVIWYVAGLEGEFTIPTSLGDNPLCTKGDCGLSHWALFNPDDGTTATTQTEVPEPASLLLLGSGLLMVRGISRKYLRSQK
jgi:hypothetical protein